MEFQRSIARLLLVLHVCQEEDVVEVCVPDELAEVVLVGARFGEELLAGDFSDGVDLSDGHFLDWEC